MSNWKFGIVRHYDDEKGRGFITEVSQSTAEHGANNNTTAVFLNDYFVVESSIKQYMPTVHRQNKRLITGEYVQFLTDPLHTPHGVQKKRVVCVRGIFGGPLIFEQSQARSMAWKWSSPTWRSIWLARTKCKTARRFDSERRLGAESNERVRSQRQAERSIGQAP
jgi:hypothetical protein